MAGIIEKNEQDVERGEGFNEDVIFKDFDFNEKTIRQGFIRKVYSILMVQLLVTLAIASVFMFVEPVKGFVIEQGVIFFLVATLGVCATMIVIFCSKKARRSSPGNYIFLGIFTLSMSFFIGVIATACQREEVFMALGICTIVCVALTLFAFQTKIDFTLFHAGLCSLLTILCTLSICSWVYYAANPEQFEQYRLMQLGVAGIGCLVFSLLLIYDTQLIIGGEHKLSISPEEYVFAALTLYLDMISMFLRILRIIRLV